jgi:hypothetical protein
VRTGRWPAIEDTRLERDTITDLLRLAKGTQGRLYRRLMIQAQFLVRGNQVVQMLTRFRVPFLALICRHWRGQFLQIFV